MLAAVLVGAAGCSSPLPLQEGEIYRWVDEQGTAHYTFDRNVVPAALRGQLDAPRTLTAATRAKPSLAPPSTPAPTAPVEPSASQQGVLPSETETSATAAVGAAASIPPALPTDPPALPTTPPALPTTPSSELDPDGDALRDRPGLEITASFETDDFSDDTPEMRQLRKQILEDREEIKRLISTGSPRQILPDPRLREIAERLARRQAELQLLGRGAKP